MERWSWQLYSERRSRAGQSSLSPLACSWQPACTTGQSGDDARFPRSRSSRGRGHCFLAIGGQKPMPAWVLDRQHRDNCVPRLRHLGRFLDRVANSRNLLRSAKRPPHRRSQARFSTLRSIKPEQPSGHVPGAVFGVRGRVPALSEDGDPGRGEADRDGGGD